METALVIQACGGCFAPTETVTSVEGHRMIISLSPERTTLWDQIRYSGNPADFVWVLPVPDAAATIELADPIFFDEIDAQTAPTVTPASPLFGCGQSGGIGCGDDASGSSDSPSDGVTVYAEDTIGPYETVTIGSEDAGALQAWLVANGYNVPDATLPTIQFYVERQSVFVVMRLAPGQGVQAMQPVRVRYPGYMATFPLKMVTVGSAGFVDLSLWVIAEQRYEAGNYSTVRIPEQAIIWDWATNKSTYGAAFDAAIENAGGRAWVVEHASPLSNLYISAYDDLQVASVGIPYPYLTRLRTHVLVDYLDEDLELRPAAQSSDVPSQLIAYLEVNRPDQNCDDGACKVGLRRKTAAAVTPMALALVLLLVIRRRRGR